jgi:thiosulfate/3-mercaptopyruvate sulfurtransferase
MHLLLLGLALLLGAEPSAARAPSGYARPDLLIEPTELATPENAKKFVVLDVRGKGSYLEGHVPGARWVDALTWAKAFGSGEDAKEWSRKIGALGIDLSTPVVVYDRGGVQDAARIWWILRYWGVRDVRMLNGGWRGWSASGGTVQKVGVKPESVEVKLTPHRERLATREQIQAGLAGAGFGQILDARSEGEFCGTTETARRNGTIPGARHLEWKEMFDGKTGRVKPAAELARLFKEAGIDPARPATTFCQSGGRASVLAFALELMGGKEVRNYYRSWAEWGNDDKTPIVKPAPAKK